MFARLITWQGVENSVEMGAVEQEYGNCSHTILMSTSDTHSFACICKHVRTQTQTHILDTQTQETRREVERISGSVCDVHIHTTKYHIREFKQELSKLVKTAV